MFRNEGYTGSLLILGATDPADVSTMIEHDISVPAYCSEWVDAVLANHPAGLKVHMKVDTGMNRIGFKDNAEIRQAIHDLTEAGAEVEGIFTHFACADTDPEFTKVQFERFRRAVEEADHSFRWIHCDNSEATLSFKDDLSNACRFGIGMYGISDTYRGLKHAVSLWSEIFLVKQVPAGETIGYGATYRTEAPEWIATMPIGYADGLVRKNQGRTVYIDGEYAPIVGRVCMDQTMIKLSRPMAEGTKVELFGPHLSLEAMAEDLGTIPYEIICLISERVTRIYTRNGTQVDEFNGRVIESKYSPEGE
jgi:alanine racemase